MPLPLDPADSSSPSEVLTQAKTVVEYVQGKAFVRTAREWSAIDEALGALVGALAIGDFGAIERATAHLERMSGWRVDELGTGEETPAPSAVHDRSTHLQTKLAEEIEHLRRQEEKKADKRR